MTYKQLKSAIEKMDAKTQNTQVHIFPFSLGCCEILNGVNIVGRKPDIDSHCEDIESNKLKAGQPYLICGL